MATKSSGKSASHRPQAQKSSTGGRKTAAEAHGRSTAQTNGKQRQTKAHPGTQRTSAKSGAAARKTKSKAGSQQERARSKPADSKKQSVGTKLGSSVKQHPIASVALGAGAGLLLVEGVRRAIGAFGTSDKARRQEANDPDQESGAEGSFQDQSQSDSDEDSGEENADDEDDESDPQSRGQEDDSQDENGSLVQGVKKAARQGYSRGMQMGQTGWQEYPLALCAAALGAGVLAGMLLPSSSIEDQMLGAVSDRAAGRLKKAGGTIKELAERAYEEAATTAREEAERAGLTPDHLGRKVKRLVVKVRDAVTDSVQG